MKLRPLKDLVLIKRDEVEEMSKGGIILPETRKKKEKTFLGTVISVGEGVFLPDGKSIRPLGVQVGNRVLFGEYAGQEIMIDEIEHRLVHDEDIIAVVVEE